MKRTLLLIAGLLAAALAFGQTLSFGLGDAGLEASLNDLGASAKVDLPGFTAEISLQWGLPAAQVQATLSQGLAPAETYLAAALASLSGKPIDTVVAVYKKNKAAGWGAVAKELGIKPGSKEFKALKDKSAASAVKAKKKGK